MVESCELKPGDWLAIVGCGGLGQIACQYAKAMGYKVIGVDIADNILEVTKTQGAVSSTRWQTPNDSMLTGKGLCFQLKDQQELR